MIDQEQKNINIALLRCIMENHKVFSSLSKMVSANDTETARDEFDTAAKGYLESLDKCLTLIESTIK